MLAKGAIQLVKDKDNPGFYSRLFLVPKKGGQYRPVINLKPLNRWIRYNHFNNGPNYSPLAVSAVVSDATHHDSGCANSPPTDSRPALPITELRLPSARMPTTPGRLEGIREKRVPENASRLIISSWRDKTNINYNSAW